MNTILAFDKKNCGALHQKAEALLKALAEEHGLTVRASGGTFAGDNAVLKFEFRCASPEAEKLEFAKNAALFNCKAEDYGRAATINREEFVLVGFNLSRPKFSVRCKGKDGKIVSFSDVVLSKYFHTGAVERPSLDALQVVPPPAFRPAVIVRS